MKIVCKDNYWVITNLFFLSIVFMPITGCETNEDLIKDMVGNYVGSCTSECNQFDEELVTVSITEYSKDMIHIDLSNTEGSAWRAEIINDNGFNPKFKFVEKIYDVGKIYGNGEVTQENTLKIHVYIENYDKICELFVVADPQK